MIILPFHHWSSSQKRRQIADKVLSNLQNAFPLKILIDELTGRKFSKTADHSKSIVGGTSAGIGYGHRRIERISINGEVRQQ